MITLFSQSQWNTSPTAYWTIQYEYFRQGADMYYRFYWKVWMGYSSSYFNDGLQLQLFLNGTQNNVTVKGHTSSAGWSYDGTTEWYKVANKTTGSTPFYAKLLDTNTSVNKATSGTYTLPVSAAASVLGGISAFDVNGSISIPITKYDTSFTDTLVITYGSTTIKTISGIANGAKVAFTSAELDTVYKLMQSVKSGTFTFALTTKTGSTTLGTSTQTATGSISGANPTFTASQVTYEDTNKAIYDITENPLHIVQNKSTLRVHFTAASGNKGATISSYTFVLNGVTKTETSAGYVDFGAVNSSKNLTLSVTVKDSRGNTTTVSKTITMLAYSSPIVDAVLKRLNNYEDTTYLTANASISSVNGKNTMTVTYKYKTVGGSYGDEEYEIANGTQYTLECDNNYAYIFSITVTDTIGTPVTREFPLDKGIFPLFIDTNLNSVGVNGFPTSANGFFINGQPVADFIVEQGEEDGWTYRKWYSGIAECWGSFGKSFAGTATTNGMYCGYITIKHPEFLASIDAVNYSVYATSGYDFSGKTVVANGNINFYICSLVAIGDVATVRPHIIGRWK